MADRLTVQPVVPEVTAGTGQSSATTSATGMRWTAFFIIVPPALLAVAGWQQRWMADDGLIHLRVVEQLLDGHGLVFNAAERVEASTSPLWVLLVALARLPRLAGPETTAVALGLVSSTLSLLLVSWSATLLWRRTGASQGFLFPLGALVLAVLPAMWDFATSGLETGLAFLWLGASFTLLVRVAVADAPRWSSAALAAFTAGFGPLVRPDFALFTMVFLFAILVAGTRAPRTRRQIVGLLATGLAVPCAYQILRMGYYGALVPNTALAKEAARARWSQGFRYLDDLVGTYLLVLPLAALLVLASAGIRDWVREGSARRVTVVIAVAAGGVLHGVYVTRVGGDFMHARMLLPSLFAVLMPVAVVEVRGWIRWAAVAVVAPWALVCAAHLRMGDVCPDCPEGISNERRWYAGEALVDNPIQAGDYAASPLWAGRLPPPALFAADGREAQRLSHSETPSLGWRTSLDEPQYTSVPLRRDLPFRTAFITPNIGIAAMLAGGDVHIVDPRGLAEPLGARIRLTARGRPGHEKDLGLAWVLARFADPRVPVPAAPEELPALWGEGTIWPSAVEAARHALTCGPFRQLEAATTGRLTVGRFMSNISLAVRLHSFRFDPDPFVAERQLCRGGSRLVRP